MYTDMPHNWIKTSGADFMKAYYQDGISLADNDFKSHGTRHIACPMAFTTMTVCSNDNVSPCCVDFIGGINLGNVDESSLQQIWNSNSWYEFQKMQLKDRKEENYSCSRCYFYLNDHYTMDNIDGFDTLKLLGAYNSKSEKKI